MPSQKKLTALYQTRKFIALFSRTPTTPLPRFSQPVQTHRSHFLKIHYNAIFPSMPIWSNRTLFLHILLSKPHIIHYLLPRCVPYDPPIAQTLIPSLSTLIFGNGYKSQDPSLYIFSTLLLLSPCFVQIFWSAIWSRKPSVYVPLSVWHIKLHTHIKPGKSILWFVDRASWYIRTIRTNRMHYLLSISFSN